MSGDYADGVVRALTMGVTELHGILSAAARRSQLVLVDFSASWCGPCRMMLPVLQQLASEHRGRLAVVKVDCEQTAANQELAASSGINAFPTFHLYRNQEKVEELRGADREGLRHAIQQQLALMGSLSGGGGGPMVSVLAGALGRVKAGCSFADFVTAAKTLLAFVANVLDHPGDGKYRRIKLSNPAYQSRLGCRAGGKECLAAIGYREMMEAGDPVLVLTDVPQELQHVRTLLQQALQQAEAAAAAAERMAGAAAGSAAAGPSAALPATPVAAAAGVAGSTSGTSAVDPTALARAPATAINGGSTGAGGTGAAGSIGSAVSAARPGPVVAPLGQHHALRVVTVTPKKLARMLAEIMRECGITGPHPAAAAQQESQEQEQE